MDGSVNEVVEIRARLAALEKQVLSILRFLNEVMQEADAPRS